MPGKQRKEKKVRRRAEKDSDALHELLMLVERDIFRSAIDALRREGIAESRIARLREDFDEYMETWEHLYRAVGPESFVSRDIEQALLQNDWVALHRAPEVQEGLKAQLAELLRQRKQ